MGTLSPLEFQIQAQNRFVLRDAFERLGILIKVDQSTHLTDIQRMSMKSVLVKPNWMIRNGYIHVRKGRL